MKVGREEFNRGTGIGQVLGNPRGGEGRKNNLLVGYVQAYRNSRTRDGRQAMADRTVSKKCKMIHFEYSNIQNRWNG